MTAGRVRSFRNCNGISDIAQPGFVIRTNTCPTFGRATTTLIVRPCPFPLCTLVSSVVQAFILHCEKYTAAKMQSHLRKSLNKCAL